MRDLDFNDLTESITSEKSSLTPLAYLTSAMEPSPIETLDTLEAKAGPSISNEIYSMIDMVEGASA